MPSFHCNHPTCESILTERGWCEKHKAIGVAKEAQRQRDQDKRRNPVAVALYRTTLWKKTSAYIRQTRPMCEACGLNKSEEAHHVIPVNEGNKASWFDTSLIMAVCGPCHARLDAAIRQEKRCV